MSTFNILKKFSNWLDLTTALVSNSLFIYKSQGGDSKLRLADRAFENSRQWHPSLDNKDMNSFDQDIVSNIAGLPNTPLAFLEKDWPNYNYLMWLWGGGIHVDVC